MDFTAILDLANSCARETEEQGALHPAVVAALTEAGILRRWVAQDYGGGGVTVSDALAEIGALRPGDGGTGWWTLVAHTTAPPPLPLSQNRSGAG